MTLVLAFLLAPYPLLAQDFSPSSLALLFPGHGTALQAGPSTGTPPAAPVHAEGRLIGYALSTRAVAGSIGYSGKPIDVHIGLNLDGRIAEARLVEHQEPILIIGIASKDLEAFVSGFAGLDVGQSVTSLKAASAAGKIDHVVGATVSSTVMRDAILRSARAVALSRSLLGAGNASTGIDRSSFKPATWSDLVTSGAIVKSTITRGEATEARDFDASEADELFVEMLTALLTPPTVGQNLLGRRFYERLTAEMGPQDNLILVAANGLYSLKGTAWRKSGIFERLQIVQDAKTIRLRAENHHGLERLEARGAPQLREIGVFRIGADTGFDPARPWQLELLVAAAGAGKSPQSFALEYQVPDALLTPALGAAAADVQQGPQPELWQQIWREHLPELIGLLLMLVILTVILFGQDWLARRRKLYRYVRMGFLAVTFLFLGLYAGAQLSVVNVVTFTHALMSGFKWDLFLLDPLVFTLWSFVALTLLFWGRGVFCGWLCPFGALQELVNKAARKLGVKQLEIPWGLHERLWPIKYVLFLAILGASLQSIVWAYQLAEVEPFKTAIALKFMRAWPFVLYVLALLAAGLFIERFFCRYVCPLGAALAIPAKLRLFEWLKRRPQCGRECRICNTTCTVQAINPLGQINPNECIYCLQCQANYHDATRCLPLKMRAARRAGRPVQAAAKPEASDAG